ncbi:MAG TPA: hypothetical protein VMH30_02705 [Verrucomicrobiae bacterium]|nr:hypothetical protein [Verrucomicrobiae bacterium]
MSQTRHKFIACFIALSLCVPFFYITRQWAINSGHGQDAITPFVFTGLEGGIHSGHFKSLNTVWKPRVGALSCAAMWLDIWNPTTDEGFEDTCGSYHAVWFGATLLLMVLALKEPIFPVMAVFAGTVYAIRVCTYNGFYNNVIIFPWDFPAMFFWALAFILWQGKRYWPMVAAIVFGTIFKESVALVAILLLFLPVPWRRRLVFFAVAFMSCLAVRLVLTLVVLGQPAIFTAGHSAFGSLWASFTRFCAWELHPHLNTILWCNGGLMLAVFFLTATDAEDFGIITVLALFALLLTVTPILDNSSYEVRQWTDCLPVLAIYFQRKLYFQSQPYERMLSPGGIIRLSVPVTRKILF